MSGDWVSDVVVGQGLGGQVEAVAILLLQAIGCAEVPKGTWRRDLYRKPERAPATRRRYRVVGTAPPLSAARRRSWILLWLGGWQ